MTVVCIEEMSLMKSGLRCLCLPFYPLCCFSLFVLVWENGDGNYIQHYVQKYGTAPHFLSPAGLGGL